MVVGQTNVLEVDIVGECVGEDGGEDRHVVKPDVLKGDIPSKVSRGQCSDHVTGENEVP